MSLLVEALDSGALMPGHLPPCSQSDDEGEDAETDSEMECN